MSGIGSFIWKISVALYLLASGALALFGSSFDQIAGGVGYIYMAAGVFNGSSVIITIVAVISFFAGLFIILEMLGISIPIVDTLIFIVAIIFAVIAVLAIISWLNGFGWAGLAQIAIILMILGSLIIASKRFG